VCVRCFSAYLGFSFSAGPHSIGRRADHNFKISNPPDRFKFQNTFTSSPSLMMPFVEFVPFYTYSAAVAVKEEPPSFLSFIASTVNGTSTLLLVLLLAATTTTTTAGLSLSHCAKRIRLVGLSLLLSPWSPALLASVITSHQ
jgi:hypothetical protein